MRENTIVLVDGHSLFHRAFFALPLLTNAKGQPTNAVYGFLTMLFRFLDEEDPAYLAVAFDRSTPTFRHESFEGYKAHRPEMADELRSQGPLLREALAALRVPTFERDGYEADDVLGTLAVRAAERGLDVILVSGDRDLLQLVGPRIRVYLTRKGLKEIEVFDAEAVRRAFGLEPAQLADVKALMGDPSDNIPGVPGVGEKTALRLIQRFGSLEGVYAHLEEAGGPRLVAALASHRAEAEMSRRLATIRCDVPVDGEPDACRRREPDREALRRLFKELGFHTLSRRLGIEENARAPAPAAAPASAAPSAASASTASAAVPAAPSERGTAAACAWVREGGRARLAAVALLPPGAAEPAILTAAGEGAAPAAEAGPPEGALAAALAAPGLSLVGHDLKPLLRWLRLRGRPAAGVAFDAAVAAYLLDPTRAHYRLEDLALQHLDREVPALEPEILADPARLGAALAARAAAARDLRAPLEAALADRGLDALHRDLELPLIGVLADMEAAGIRVDPATLDDLRREFTARAEALAEEIHALAGETFNILSPQQLGEVLFVKLGLPAGKKTKTGWSTDASVLESLAARHPIAARVLEYRQVTKLLGTYVDGLRAQIEADGRVRCTFQQTVTATGRLSSVDPNLQNIPVREELGRRLRRAFVAAPGHLLLAADYSQIELRVLAHMAGDEVLIAAFRRGEDIHRATAAEVFGVPREAVDEALRARAKAVNFGIIYGITDFGLSQNIGIGRAEARAFIDAYLARFPGVRRYMDEVVRRARAEGVVRTLMGRVRPLPEIQSRNFVRRQFAERTALNTPIQGTAADIIKTAMVRVHRELAARGLRSRLLLQVHDELILEVPEDELAAARDLVVAAMEGAADLAVPLRVDVKAGPNWYDQKPLA